MDNTFELSSAMRFLIIDDNESYRVSIVSSLRKLGFRDIQQANTSLSAIHSLKANIVDLIICDRNMPLMDGAQILKEIRESFEIKGTPFLMTGVNSKITKEDLILLAEYEIDGYLTKPFTPRNLIEKITLSLEHYKNPNNLEYKIALAKHKLSNHKVEMALKMFEKILEIAPNSARVRVCMARCYRELKNYPSALTYCNDAIEKNPLYAQSYDEMGKVYLEQNKIEEALTCFKNAVAISPSYPVRYEQIVDILIQKELYKDAEFILKKAVENQVIFDDLDVKYGHVLYYLRKLDKALLYFEKGVKANPTDKSLLNIMGICLKDLGRFEDALKHYNIALKRYPGDTKILFNKALCLIALVRLDQATKILKQILLLEPGNSKVAAKLKELAKETIAS